MRYEELLAQPHVCLALDPEWRLAPGERRLHDIGQVTAGEVNAVPSTPNNGDDRQKATPQGHLLSVAGMNYGEVRRRMDGHVAAHPPNRQRRSALAERR